MSLSREHYQAELGALRRVHRSIKGYQRRNKQYDLTERAAAFGDAALLVMWEMRWVQSQLRRILGV